MKSLPPRTTAQARDSAETILPPDRREDAYVDQPPMIHVPREPIEVTFNSTILEDIISFPTVGTVGANIIDFRPADIF